MMYVYAILTLAAFFGLIFTIIELWNQLQDAIEEIKKYKAEITRLNMRVQEALARHNQWTPRR